MDEDVSWREVAFVAVLLAALLAFCTWRALDALNAPAFAPSTSTTR